MGTEPRKGTPEGDQFDGKIYMGAALVVFLVLTVLFGWLFGLVAGGVMFALGALKWHAGLVRKG